MILPLYICLECGKFGGMGLSFSQMMARSAKGEKYQEGDSDRVECPEGHGLMYKVQENDRLYVVSNTIDSHKPLTDHQKYYIKQFLGDGYGKCTDGYLMTKLGLSDWKEAEKLIEQYEREGKNETS